MRVEQVYFEGPYQAACREVELPPPGRGEVLLRSLLSAISHGTEMNVYRVLAPQWSQHYDRDLRLFLRQEGGASWDYPLAYGYACVGVVEAAGEDLDPALVGRRAFCYRPHQAAHVLPVDQLVPIGDLPAEKGIFFANANTALNGVLDATLHYGDEVTVFGQGVIGLDATLHYGDEVTVFGQGVIGQILAQICKASGCRVVVVDGLTRRLQFARGWGADVTINPNEVDDVALAVREVTERRGADTVFDVTGNPRALHEAIRTAAPDCQVVAISWYGKPASDLVLSGEFHHNRVHIRSSQVGRINPLLVNWSLERRGRTALDLLWRLKVEEMITARFRPEQAAEAYRAVDQGEDPPLQAVFTYQ
jgi:threonine dehydrogenase-like Zn-dependent dehydrogenase